MSGLCGALRIRRGKGSIRRNADDHMYHGITYSDEAYSEETRGRMTLNFWYPEMKNGIIVFPRPQDCPNHKMLHETKMKIFQDKNENFTGLREFGEVK